MSRRCYILPGTIEGAASRTMLVRKLLSLHSTRYSLPSQVIYILHWHFSKPMSCVSALPISFHFVSVGDHTSLATGGSRGSGSCPGNFAFRAFFLAFKPSFIHVKLRTALICIFLRTNVSTYHYVIIPVSKAYPRCRDSKAFLCARSSAFCSCLSTTPSSFA